MLDIYAAREAYKALEINKIGFVKSSYYLADSLTKPKVQTALNKLLLNASHESEVYQLILRDLQ